jgi:hypothetical protein
MGGKGKNNKSRKYNKRGGCGSCVLSPAPFGGVATLPSGGDANFAKVPTMPPSSTMVGGGIGYGYANGADASIFGGNYFPISKGCMSGIDSSRGGNNFMSGGRRSRRRGAKRSSGKRSRKHSGGKRKRSSTKRSSTKRRGGKKWRQKGCMSGGILLV